MLKHIRQEMFYAYATSPILFDHPSIRAPFLEAYLGACSDLVVGRDSCAGQTDRDQRLAHHGAEPGAAFPELPSGVEPCSVELSKGQSCFAPLADLCLRSGRPTGVRLGRYHRTAARREDSSTRHLSRPGAVLANPFRQDRWIALVEFDAAHSDSLGSARLGSPVLNRPHSFGAF